MTSFEKHIEKSDEVAMAATPTWNFKCPEAMYIFTNQMKIPLLEIRNLHLLVDEPWQQETNNYEHYFLNRPETVLKQNEAMRVMWEALKGYADSDSDPDGAPITQAAKQALAKVEAIFSDSKEPRTSEGER